MARCERIKADGQRCKGIAIRGEEWCPAHHPDHQERRRRNASKGGKRGGRGRPVVELSNLKQRLEELADDVLGGRIDRQDAAVAGQLLNYAIRAVSVGLKAKEVEELEGRLEELEAALAQRKDASGWR